MAVGQLREGSTGSQESTIGVVVAELPLDDSEVVLHSRERCPSSFSISSRVAPTCGVAY